MSHTVLLSQLERLHNRIQMLETNVGLGARNPPRNPPNPPRRIVQATISADSLAAEIIDRVMHWAHDRDPSELRDMPTRMQITNMEHFIRNHSSGIRKEDLSKSLSVKLQSVASYPYTSHFVPGIWDAFYAVYGRQDGDVVTDRVIQDILKMISKWPGEPRVSNILSLQTRVMRDKDRILMRNLIQILRDDLNGKGYQYKDVIIRAIEAIK